METKSTLTKQLATLGIHLPDWPEEPETEFEGGDWIQRGRVYAEGVQLWRAQLRNSTENIRAVVDHLLQHLRETSQLCLWDQLVDAAIKPEVQGSPDSERWQVCTKLIRSSALTPAQIWGTSLEMAREQRLVAATYGLRRLLKEQADLSPIQRLILCAELISTANTSRINKETTARYREWVDVVALHENLSKLLLEGLALLEKEKESSSSDQTDCSALLSRLDKINDCLGKKGAHGHENFLLCCKEFLPRLLCEWQGEIPWIIEVGCSREIIEGQNSTAQLIRMAEELGLPFCGIDLDAENIDALQRDHNNLNANWIVGKGEEELGRWSHPIAACYLDAYDFWHTNHSYIRQETYIRNYGQTINDTECRQMHLLAACRCDSLIPSGGILGIDDTWLDKGEWQGKGALALPWLLEQGWQLISQANRGAVLCKSGQPT